MSLTLEVRLFAEGRLPNGVASLFSSINPEFQPLEEERTDVYLVLPQCRSVGVKARGGESGGKFEVKALSEPIEFAPATLFGHSVGVERWVKWSYGEPPVSGFISALVTGNHSDWLTVEKRRWTRKFTLDAERLVELAPNERPDAAANVELVAVRAKGQDSWGIGVEAFGPQRLASTILSSTLSRFADRTPGFEDLRSLSYAGFVSEFFKPAQTATGQD